MRSLFSAIAKAMQWPIHRLRDNEAVATHATRKIAPVTILFQDHGRFAEDIKIEPGDAGWHLVRDPRDVLISAANYHGWSNEPWLHQPRENLGGKTYHATIKPLSLDDAVRFEMDRSAGRALRDMLSFDRHSGAIRDVAYETLLGDRSGVVAQSLFEELGFEADTVETCLRCYRQSHARAGSARDDGLHQHIQNLDDQQWRYLFDAKLLSDFEQRYPGMAEKLGYPPSDPSLLHVDMPRQQAYLAKFEANRGNRDAAIARLEVALEKAPGSPQLLGAVNLIARSQGQRGDTA